MWMIQGWGTAMVTYRTAYSDSKIILSLDWGEARRTSFVVKLEGTAETGHCSTDWETLQTTIAQDQFIQSPVQEGIEIQGSRR